MHISTLFLLVVCNSYHFSNAFPGFGGNKDKEDKNKKVNAKDSVAMGIDMMMDAASDPTSMKEAMSMLEDPATRKEVEAMMKNPGLVLKAQYSMLLRTAPFAKSISSVLAKHFSYFPYQHLRGKWKS
jgi:hypothetical protein